MTTNNFAKLILCSLILTSAELWVGDPELRADDAATLPKGLWRVRWAGAFTYVTDRFDSNGTSSSLGDDYSLTIGTSFLSALKPQVKELVKNLNAVQPGLGDNLSIAEVNMEIETNIISNRFVVEYGVTDQLSLGAILPVATATTQVNANSRSTADFQTALAAAPDALKPALMAMAQATSLDAMNQSLRQDLGYDSGLESWSGSGLGDLELGAKYNYLKTHPFQLSFKAGVRLPTGRTDDPNNLFDVAFGDGQYDIGFYNYADYHLLGNLYFSWEAGYTIQLPHTADYRVPVIQGVSITPVMARLDHNPGDIVETGVEANYDPFRTIKTAVRYQFRQKFEDEFSGGNGVSTSALAENTDSQLHQAIFTIGYTNIPLVKAKEASLPIEFLVFYQWPFAGKNTSQAQTTGIQLKSYF